MTLSLRVAFVVALSALLASVQSAKQASVQKGAAKGDAYKTADWAYDYNEAEWANIYPTCGSGMRQSPIDVPSCHSRSSCDKPKVGFRTRILMALRVREVSVVG